MNGEKRVSKSGRVYTNYYQKKRGRKYKANCKMLKETLPNGRTRYYYPPRHPSRLPSSFPALRKYLLKLADYKCEVCGQFNDTLYIHHKDGRGYYETNHPNNDPSNVQVVCPYCHQFLHNHTNTNNHNTVISLRHSGRTFEEIGQLFGVSRQRAYQLYQKEKQIKEG